MNWNSIGLIEVHGWVPAIAAGDAMVKAADVRLLRQHSISPGFVTVIVEGDLGSCRAAVDAGVAAAARLGTVLAQLVIGRPDPDTWDLSGPLLAAADLSRRGFNGRRRKAAVPPGKVIDQPVLAGASEETPTPAGWPNDSEAGALLAYIGSSNRGRTAQEVARHFKQPVSETRALLEQWAVAGRLGRTGARYLLG
ncbi:BMC domain-containing protein [Dechloromonas denitrificans]|uniref:BMC domain-containing protein n=1 Tax=Dechloromonas denitrificans TaxID=281362 RepID=UPI00299E3887|nr:BMC domain-containing protein [Dechloromonas denitrificans]UCV08630.1 BMC domain-containing protein [Dechloromonas denitrificans]